jgi:hypothetical protein
MVEPIEEDLTDLFSKESPIMPEKKPVSGKQKPVHVVRCGEVTAAVYLRQSNAGFSYYDFSLGRCWNSMATGKESHGSSFFEKHEEDLLKAIRQASEWVREKTRPAPADGVPEAKTPLT